MEYTQVNEGDMNALAMKVIPTFSVGELIDTPVGSHVLLIHIDMDTAKLVAIEGRIIDEGFIESAREMMQDQGMSADDRFSSTMVRVVPVTNEEANAHANALLAEHGFTTIQDLEAVSLNIMRRMIARAYKEGRGVNAS